MMFFYKVILKYQSLQLRICDDIFETPDFRYHGCDFDTLAAA